MQAAGGAQVLRRRNLSALLAPTGPLVLPAVILLLDQSSKAWARSTLSSRSVELVGDFFQLRLVYNTGAAFGILQGGRWVFLGLAIPVGAALFVWSSRAAHPIQRVSAGLLLGGLVGNSWDRLVAPAGRVTDFIAFSFWPAFNLADSAMVVGVSLFVIHRLLGWPRETSPEISGDAS